MQGLFETPSQERKYRYYMETASFFIVALEKVDFEDKKLKKELEQKLMDTIEKIPELNTDSNQDDIIIDDEDDQEFPA